MAILEGKKGIHKLLSDKMSRKMMQIVGEEMEFMRKRRRERMKRMLREHCSNPSDTCPIRFTFFAQNLLARCKCVSRSMFDTWKDHTASEHKFRIISSGKNGDKHKSFMWTCICFLPLRRKVHSRNVLKVGKQLTPMLRRIRRTSCETNMIWGIPGDIIDLRPACVNAPSQTD